MAQLVTVRLSRTDSSPWGFRLQGGKDFGTPLLIQKVNGGGLAEKAGLHVGDALIKVNNVDVSDMRHKDAQDTLVKAGNSFELSVQRGPQSTWRPQVATVGSLPMPGGASPQNVTRTSLTKPRQPTTPIGSGHNISPRPFASTPQMNGGLFNKQYNSPVGIYSEETIAETLSAQAEVLAGGVLGVNFKKNEKTYDSQKSEVYKMVQEVDKEPKEPEPAMSHTKFFSTISHAVGGRATSPRPRTPIAQQLGTPQPPQDKPYMPPQSPHPSGSPQCTDCGKSIVGIFVRIKDKNLHVECFKCATCGTSLKNVGYYNINNKLYCDIHAKLVARQNPPAPNMDPITVPPGVRTPVGALTTSAAANISSPTPSSPQHGTLAPLPFHTQSAPTGPKPFGSQPVAAPPTPASVPFNVQSAAPMSTFGMKPQSTDHGHSVVWPPSSQDNSVTTFHPPHKITNPKEPNERFSTKNISEQNIDTLKSEDFEDPPTTYIDSKKRMSLCSQEVCCLSDKKIEKGNISSVCENYHRPQSPIPEKQIAKSKITHASSKHLEQTVGISEGLGSEKIQKSIRKTVDGVSEERVKRTTVAESFHRTSKAASQQVTSISKVQISSRSESPELLDVSSKPHEIRSLLPPASAVRPLTPTQVVVFPPELPPELPLSRSTSATPQPEPLRNHPKIHEHEKELPPKSHRTEKNISQLEVEDQVEEQLFTKTQVERIVREEIDKIFSDKKDESIGDHPHPRKMSINDLPRSNLPSGPMTFALTTAPERPFTPVQPPTPIQLPKPIKKNWVVPTGPVPLPAETEPYFPPPHPGPGKEENSDKIARALREVGCRSPMTEALTIAPDRPYSPLPPATHPLASTSQSAPISTSATFQPISVDPKVPTLPHGKKPISMLSALTVAPEVPFTVPGKTPIPTIQSESINGINATIPVTGQGAFKPVQSSSSSSVVPKSITPTDDNGGTVTVSRLTPKYYPAVTYVPQVKHENVTVIDRPKIGTDEKLVSKEQSQILHESMTKMTELTAETSRTSTKVSSGLHCPNMLPHYQQNISEIPACNKSISPTPHPIKAPSVSPITVKKSVNVAAQRISSAQKRTGVSAKKATFEEHTFVQPEVSTMTKSKIEGESRQTKKQFAKMETALQSKISLSKPKVMDESFSTNLLPYYQQNIGEIPVRNRSISPVPHPIRAPMINPEPWPTRTTPSPIQKRRTNLMTAKQFSEYQASQTKKEIANVAEKSSFKSQKTNIDINKTKQIFKPEIRVEHSSMKEMHRSMVKEKYERSLSPCSWKAKVRTVQNLSPIEVRLPSPVPKGRRTPKPINVTADVTSANVVIKPSPKISGLVSSTPIDKSPKSSTVSHHAKSSSTVSQHVKSSSTPPIPKSSTAHHTSSSGNMSSAIHHSTGSSQSTKSLKASNITLPNLQETNIQPIDVSSHIVNTTISQSPSSYTKSSTAISQSYKSEPSYSSFQSQSSSVKSDGTTQSTKMSRETASTYSKSQQAMKVSSLTTSLSGVGGVSPGSSSGPNTGGGGPRGTGTIAGSTAPRRGRGVLNTTIGPGARIPICGQCNNQIRGPFITALGKIWCPEHFLCVNAKCRRPLQDLGFVEESEGLYCEYCFEQYLAPTCSKCNNKIKGDCLNAIGKQFHPECFSCAYCGKLFGNNPFFLEDSLPYCENDWNELFTTKCFSCGFPIEAGDRWVEALNNNYHSQCFNCTMCKKNLEGQSFFAKGGRPFCKNHAR